jgi:hypothetical protein
MQASSCSTSSRTAWISSRGVWACECWRYAISGNSFGAVSILFGSVITRRLAPPRLEPGPREAHSQPNYGTISGDPPGSL